MITLVCPRCHSNFESNAGTFFCPQCATAYPINDGIPDVRTGSEPYWGEVPRERMAMLLDDAARTRWDTALQKFCSERNDPGLFGRVTDGGRANWRYYIPLGPDAAVLDAGAGWGAISFSLANHYRQVVAFDNVPERARFVECRRRQEGQGSLQCVCGTMLQLPFKDHTFDLVVLNGVLEWLPLSDPARPAYDVQVRALREAHRVLKPSGYLYIGIENRYGIDYFLGFKDHHSGLKYATLLPRPLADFYSRIVKKTPYRTLTHSCRGYRALLKRAGFPAVDFLYPVSTYRKFYYLIPLKSRNATEFAFRNLLPQHLIFVSPLVKILHAAALLAFTLRLTFLVKWFATSYSIIARKQHAQ